VFTLPVDTAQGLLDDLKRVPDIDSYAVMPAFLRGLEKRLKA
jgi:hypothetical protein